jgi:hypothetical protein
MDETPPNIDSFVIRFIHQPLSEKPQESGTPLSLAAGQGVRGSVRHVQTNQEKGFTNWEEVEEFIRQYVPALLSGSR